MLARPEVYIIYKYKYVESGEHNAEIILLDNWKFWHFHKTIKAARWTASFSEVNNTLFPN